MVSIWQKDDGRLKTTWLYGVLNDMKEKNFPENLWKGRELWRLKIWKMNIHRNF